MIELGREVKDRVTGFTGIAIAETKYLNGCVQLLVMPKMATPKKNETPEHPTGTYIDVEQLVVVGRKKIVLSERDEPSGGVRQHP